MKCTPKCLDQSKPQLQDGLTEKTLTGNDCELLNLERELVTGTINLSQPKPPKLDLHTHAVHLMYRSRFDDASNCGGETKLELLATEGDGGSRTP